MKKYTIIGAILLALVGVEAQAQLNDSGNHGLMNISTRENPALSKVEGSPFLDDDFKYGVAKIEGKDPLNVYVRYDVATEQMEIKTDPKSPDIYMLPPGQHAVYKVGDKTFKYGTINHEGKNILGYYVEHFGGDNYKLVTKHRAEISEAVKAKTGYDRDKPAKIKIEEDLFILGKDGTAWKVRAKNRDLEDIFKTPAAKDYLSDNKVRSTEDLVAFVAFIDKQ